MRRLTRRDFLRLTGSALVGLGFSGVLRGAARGAGAGLAPLRISWPLSLAAFPTKIGIEKGVFAELGLQVEEIMLLETPARHDAFIAGRLDALICDVSTAVFALANGEAAIAITSTAFEPVGDDHYLVLVGSGPFHIDSLEKLFQRIDRRDYNSIMLLENTDMEFATDQLLARLGQDFDDEEVYAPGHDLVNTFTMLIGGSVLAAVLPEPLATIAGPENTFLQERDRGHYLSTYEGVPVPPVIIAFRREFLEEHEEEVRLFHEGYRRAVEVINGLPREELLDMAAELGLEVFNQIVEEDYTKEDLPEGYMEIFAVPQFPQPRLLREEELAMIVDWARRKGYIETEVAYSQAVDGRFVG